MLPRADLAISGVKQENVRKLKMARHDASPSMPFDVEILLDCEDHELRDGEAFVLDIGGDLRFAYARDLPTGIELRPAYGSGHIETIPFSSGTPMHILGRAFSVTWLSG